MEEGNEILLNTNGFCFLCLRPSTSSGGNTNPVGRDGGIISLQAVAQYLKMDVKKVYSDAISVDPGEIPVWEQPHLKGFFCGNCTLLVTEFSEAYAELERIQLVVQKSLGTIHNKITTIQGDHEAVKKFRTGMWSKPHTLVHYGLVQRMRKETLEKCSLLMKKVDPKVELTRGTNADFDIKDVKPVAETSTSQQRYTANNVKTEEDDDYNIGGESGPISHKTATERGGEAHSSFNDPVISSIHGNYNQWRGQKRKSDLQSSQFRRGGPGPLSARRQRQAKVGRDDNGEVDVGIGIYPIPVHVELTEEDRRHQVQQQNRQKETPIHNRLKILGYKKGKGGARRGVGRPKRNQMKKAIPSAVAVAAASSSTNVVSSSGSRDTKKHRWSKNPLAFSCDRCPTRFTAKYLVFDHIRTVHEGQRFKCNLCREVFMVRSDFQKHKRRVHNMEGGNGGIPIQSKATKTDIASYQDVEEEETQQQPLQMNSAAENENLRIRIRIPPQSQSRPTPTTSFQETKKKLLATASQSLRNAKKLQVDKSKKEVGQGKGRARGHDPAPGKGRRRLQQCRLCPEQFPLRYLLTDHVQIVHNGKPIACKVCKPTPTFFSSRAEYSRHYRTVHLHGKSTSDENNGNTETGTTAGKGAAADSPEVAEVIGFRMEELARANNRGDSDNEQEMKEEEGEASVPIPISMDSDQADEEAKKEERDVEIIFVESETEETASASQERPSSVMSSFSHSLASSSFNQGISNSNRSSVNGNGIINGAVDGGHRQQEERRNKYQCGVCFRSFPMSGALQLHYKKSGCQQNSLMET